MIKRLFPLIALGALLAGCETAADSASSMTAPREALRPGVSWEAAQSLLTGWRARQLDRDPRIVHAHQGGDEKREYAYYLLSSGRILEVATVLTDDVRTVESLRRGIFYPGHDGRIDLKRFDPDTFAPLTVLERE